MDSAHRRAVKRSLRRAAFDHIEGYLPGFRRRYLIMLILAWIAGIQLCASALILIFLLLY